MKFLRRFITVILALVLLSSMGMTVAYAQSNVIYENGDKLFKFKPGSSYTDTDLFGNFKGVMPGDVLTETITVTNNYIGCEYIKVYMRAVPHDASNPLSPSVAEQETVESSNDFLSQLSMTVRMGDKVLFDASPEELDGLKENVLLGSLNRGETVDLTVELRVPIELENEYANRIGEVDWVFCVAQMEDEPPTDSPQTGDNSNMALWIALLFISGMGIVATTVYGRKKRHAR